MKVTIQPKAEITLVMPDGKEYPMTKPTLGSQIELEAKIAEAEKSGKGSGSQMILEHLVSCGLPIEVSSTLDIDQLTAVQEVLKPAKKN